MTFDCKLLETFFFAPIPCPAQPSFSKENQLKQKKEQDEKEKATRRVCVQPAQYSLL